MAKEKQAAPFCQRDFPVLENPPAALDANQKPPALSEAYTVPPADSLPHVPWQSSYLSCAAELAQAFATNVKSLKGDPRSGQRRWAI
jgi:hypothetical protein